MRNLIVTENLSLDGVMEAPEKWAFAYQDADLLAVNQAAMENADALLLGRETFEEFAAYWQYQNDEQGFGEKMNRSNKYVVSETLENVTWVNSSHHQPRRYRRGPQPQKATW